mgnify:CR=1 FL=1
MNIKLIGTVLATSLLATSAFAGDPSVEDKYKVVKMYNCLSMVMLAEAVHLVLMY